jgi:hypothetical protein
LVPEAAGDNEVKSEKGEGLRNLEVKSLHKKQENLTTENTEITEIFSNVFSVDSACTWCRYKCG